METNKKNLESMINNFNAFKEDKGFGMTSWLEVAIQLAQSIIDGNLTFEGVKYGISSAEYPTHIHSMDYKQISSLGKDIEIILTNVADKLTNNEIQSLKNAVQVLYKIPFGMKKEDCGGTEDNVKAKSAQSEKTAGKVLTAEEMKALWETMNTELLDGAQLQKLQLFDNLVARGMNMRSVFDMVFKEDIPKETEEKE